jgi:hypothetical protein
MLNIAASKNTSGILLSLGETTAFSKTKKHRGPKVKSLVGLKFGHLTVLKRYGTQTPVVWECRCNCGNICNVTAAALKSGNTKTCGCLRGKHNRTHGHAYAMYRKSSPTYQSWANMKDRSLNPKNPQWKDYGGRGITIAKRWMAFEEFLKDMGEMPPGYSLERKDVNGNYQPSNCIWIPRSEQNKNKRNSKKNKVSA